MKEFSIEEKAKRYDKAINTIRNLVKAGLIYEDAAIQVFSELKESEDEKSVKNLISTLSNLYARNLIEKETKEKYTNWLKSIKDRVQPKQEWGEEDEKKRTLLISILEVNHPNGYFKVNPANTLNMAAMHTEELVNWLKSIRPKNTWKPDELQLECLSDAIKHYNSLEYPATKLKELLDDLKKLREE